jgi:hypothetical protein
MGAAGGHGDVGVGIDEPWLRDRDVELAWRDLEGDDTVRAGPVIDPCRRDPSVRERLSGTSDFDADRDLLLLSVRSETEGEKKEGESDVHASGKHIAGASSR